MRSLLFFPFIAAWAYAQIYPPAVQSSGGTATLPACTGPVSSPGGSAACATSSAIQSAIGVGVYQPPIANGTYAPLASGVIPLAYLPSIPASQITGTVPGGPSGTVTVPTTTGTTYYVSQSQGADSNNGTSPATPWKTLAKVNSSAFNPGDQILLSSQDVWHEQLTIPSSGNATAALQISSYGPNRCITGPYTSAPPATNCQMPTIDGADVVTGWTVQSGTTYQSPYTSVAAKGFVDSLYVEAVPLALQTSIAAVNSTAGSLYSDGTNVYVHLFDNSNPANHAVEISGTRKYNLYVSDKNYVIVDGIRGLRAYGSGVLFAQSSDNGTSGTYAEYNTVRNCWFFNSSSKNYPDAFSGDIAIRSFAYTGQKPLHGYTILANRLGRMDNPPVLDYQSGALDITGTTAGAFRYNFIAAVNAMGVNNRYLYNGTTGDTSYIDSNEVTNSQGNISGEVLNSIVSNNYIHDSFGYGIQVWTGSKILYNRILGLLPSADGNLYNGVDENGASAQNGVAIGNYIAKVSSSCFTLEADTGAALGWTLINNTFDASQNLAYNGAAPTPSVSGGIILYVRDASLPGLTMSGNTYIPNAAVPTGFRYAATSAGETSHDLSPAQFIAAYPQQTPVTAGTFYGAMTTPASSTAGCTAGQFTNDANYHYVCTAPNTWKRVALTTF